MRSAAFFVLACALTSCYTPPAEPVVGVWDRFIADGQWLPKDGPRDRYTFGARGSVRLERDGQVLDGRMPDVEGDYVTIELPEPMGTVQWFMQRAPCIDILASCLLMSHLDGDRHKTGAADWYH